jgi:FkbM family methyltransferase
MNQTRPERVKAVHPYWNGHLLLNHEDQTVEHEKVGTQGTFFLANGRLNVIWQFFEPECFVDINDVYIQETLLAGLPDVRTMEAVAIRGTPLAATRVSVWIPGTRHEVSLRLRGSDYAAFIQVFLDREYDSPNLPDTAETIVDLGANIGLASLFFGLRYPNARILAVEPDAGNFAALTANTAALRGRLRCLHAAAWHADGEISLHTQDATGQPLLPWAVQVSELPGQSRVKSCTVKTLLDLSAFAEVDILKVDIEGAELEIFSHNPWPWLPRVKLIIVETHDRFRLGSEAAVRGALASGFEELPPNGENLFFRRRG